MFRKYAALAAGLMLIPAVHSTRAERPHVRQKGRSTTFAAMIPSSTHAGATFVSANGTKQAVIPTLHAEDGIFAGADALLAAAPPSSTGDDYTTQTFSAQEEKMANLLNQDRLRNGLAPLTLDAELCRIARIKSADMRDGGYFAHESPTYGDIRAMLRQFGYAFSAAGENIAHHANVDKAQAAFMSSSGHRAAILSSAWTKVGIGIVTDGNGFIYATQIFVKEALMK